MELGKLEITGVSGNIYQSVYTLLSTPVGTVVFDREYGLDWSGVDEIPLAAETLLVVEIEEKLERYEPRVRLVDIETSAGANGKIDLKV